MHFIYDGNTSGPLCMYIFPFFIFMSSNYLKRNKMGVVRICLRDYALVARYHHKHFITFLLSLYTKNHTEMSYKKQIVQHLINWNIQQLFWPLKMIFQGFLCGAQLFFFSQTQHIWWFLCPCPHFSYIYLIYFNTTWVLYISSVDAY